MESLGGHWVILPKPTIASRADGYAAASSLVSFRDSASLR
jgi:hypothetical protein